MGKFLSVTVSLLLLLSASSAWAKSAGVVRIPSQVIVRHQEVTLGDIATFDGVNAIREKQLRSVSLGSFDQGPSTKELSGMAVRVRLDLSQAHVRDVELEIPETITLCRSLEVLSRVQQRNAIREQQVEPDIEIPSPAPKLAQLPPSRGLSSSDKGYTRGVMLITNLQPGEVFTRKDLTYVNFNRPRKGVIPSMDLVVGRRALKQVRRRTILRSEMFGDFDVVQGEQVRVQVRGDGFSVETLANAGSNGVVGEVILVTNIRTRRSFSARVSGPGLVEALF